jgi:alanine-synthesizing transaminase
MFSARTGWPLKPNKLMELCQERRRAARPILDLTESNPTRCGFEYDIETVLKAFRNPEVLNYQPDPRGLVSAREAIREYYRERCVELDASQIFLTASTSEAYSFIFRLIGAPGDQVLAPQPSYPLFDFLTRLNDLELSHYPLLEEDRWRIDHRAFATRLSRRTRAAIAVHPNNPTGSFIHSEDREFLIDRCARHQLALIADEVFHDYTHDNDPGERPATFAGEKRVLVFVLNGLSKVSALPQMKCAWIVFSGPDHLVREAAARMEVITDTYLSVSTAAALALPQLLALRRSLQPQITARIKANLACLDQTIGMASPVSRLEVEGGWYAVLRLPGLRSDEEWCVQFLEDDDVLVHPGHFYDFCSESRIVVSLICRPEVFKEGVTRFIGRVERDSCGMEHPAQ